jgi:hypothetical protein
MVGAEMFLGISPWCAASLLSGKYLKTYLNGLCCILKLMMSSVFDFETQRVKL